MIKTKYNEASLILHMQLLDLMIKEIGYEYVFLYDLENYNSTRY